MNRDEIMRWAQELGCVIPSGPEEVEFFFYPQELERFAHLVYESVFRDANIAASRTILDAAVLEEREACAKMCDLMEQQAEGTDCCKWPTPIDCAAAIRARSNP